MSSASRVLVAALGVSAAACSGSPPPPPQAVEAPPAPPPEPQLSEAAPRTLEPVADARLQVGFEAGRLEGTVALYDTAEGVLRCGDLERCRRGYIPASTFKIANALIAAENGVVTSPETPLRWDGQTYPVEAWNRDHTLLSAFRASCVPCFQQVAREIGEARMRDWLARLEYGNQDSTGTIDLFWLRGQLRITPLEQLDFLFRLDTGALPSRSESNELVRTLMEIEKGDRHVLRGKTGWAAPPDIPEEVGWFVGWVELGRRRVYFATLVDQRAPEVDMATARNEVTERALQAVGVEL
jgi:beta-lactamase class D